MCGFTLRRPEYRTTGCAFSLPNVISGIQHTNNCSYIANESNTFHTIKITVVPRSSGQYGGLELSGLRVSGSSKENFMENSHKMMTVPFVYRLFSSFKQSAIIFFQIANYWGLQAPSSDSRSSEGYLQKVSLIIKSNVL